ncbi:probable G-protein coupled receptor 34 [Oxyura jamaicensis]|uniref:probable G-protein coupled receptor 34 n=1 Tax=Oxyura jamaicensis TaxID=8884 RepID=UPI0015A6AB17|nr:probable G-protein coupled receptor 34 [Oxyura jamaicensis]
MGSPHHPSWETSRRQRRGRKTASGGIYFSICPQLPTLQGQEDTSGHLPCSCLCGRWCGTVPASPGTRRPRWSRGQWVQVRGALLWDVFTPPAPEAHFCLSPVHLGVLQSLHRQEPPKTLPSPHPGGENPAWEEQGERGDACHGWEVCHQPRAYSSPGESRNLRHSSCRSRGAPGEARALVMDSLSTVLPTSEVTEHRLGNSCSQIRDEFLSVTLPVMYSLIFIVGLLSNTLALWVFSCSVQRMTSITVYMRNLALSDLLLSLCLPFRIAFQNKSEPRIFCNVVGAFFYLNMYVSITFLSLISLDRYLKIIRPLQKFKIHTVACSTVASGLVWLVHLAFMMPFFFETREKGPCDYKCFHFRNKSTTAAAFNMTAVVIFFILLLLFLYFYGKIFAKLHRVSSVKAQQLNKKTSMRAITKTFVVLIIFIVCFTPYHIIRIPYILAQVEAISSLPWKQGLHLANELVLCISALNSCLDPVVFFFLSSSFRRAVLCTFQGRLKRALMRNQGRLNHSRSVTEM